MANRLKKKEKQPPPPDPEKLAEDKVEEVTVKEVVKDERTAKIAGSVSLLLSIFLFVAFTSYLFTWQDDQDKVHRFGVQIFAVDDIRVHNLLGVLGAFAAHFFIYKGFGLASFLFCTFFFVLGTNLLTGKKVFSLVRNVRYIITGLVVISMTLAFVSRISNSDFSWGGAVGDLMNGWFVKWIGNVGTGAVLALAVFAYVIWRFNPTFKWPEPKPKPAPQPIADEPETEEDYAFQQAAMDAYKQDYTEEMTLVTREPEMPLSNNKLKNGAAVTVLMPEPAAAEEPNPLTSFGVTEREEAALFIEDSLPLVPEPVVVEPLMVTPTPVEPQLQSDVHIDDLPPTLNRHMHADLQLEIKAPVEEEIEDDIPFEVEAPEDPLETVIDEEPAEADETQLEIRSEELATINYDPTLDLRDYQYPSINLLETHGSEKIIQDPAELEANKNQIITTLKNYDIAIQRISATVGPTVTLYEIVPAPGVRISRIKNLEDDIALSLAALGIRIIAPIPGKGTIGIEVPNVRKTVVSMKTLLASDKFQNNNYSLPIAIGKKIDNENFIVDLAAMPHLLMAGATGQGKSVGINTLLVSLLYKKHPSQLKFVLVDPKKVELSLYRTIEKHFLAKLPGEEESIITDTKKVVHTLNALCIEMDNRYDLLKEAGCRNIKEYNEKFMARKLNPQKGHQYLPFIVLVVDEFADLIMTAGKEVEMPIARLAQLARAIGIHLIIATQRPSVNIITGTIKANFPARIAFKVSSKIDSRTILDTGGAEQLIGKGDMLISYNGEVTRLQCAFVDTPEVEGVCEFIGDQRGYPDAFLLPEYTDEKEEGGKDFDAADRDPLFEDAARLIVQNQIGSTSLIQRRMKLGYNRAGRLMDQLEHAGIVGPNLGSKAREVHFKTEAELQEFFDSFG